MSRKGGGLEIEGGQNSLGIGIFDDAHQALLLPHMKVLVLAHVAHGRVGLLYQSFHVSHGKVRFAAHHDGFQVLASHDGADARAARIPAPIAIDAGEPHQVFTRHADGGHMNIVGSKMFFDEAFRLQATFAFELRHRNDLRLLIVINEEDGKFWGGPDNGHTVQAGLAQFHAKRTAHGRITVQAGCGRNGHIRGLA
ncbi:MAG: hypothetical protein BWX80_00397 [Candidatus Hydrogenedentes bacterium ADurb.Bin101]|nr:MAG: hypothetical protein BWX80_00397 [Candidatus Hydrogenedentes bacterium ADurb.Bin101]